MALNDLNKNQQKVVYECLKASAEGPFFDDNEFQTLFGLYRDEVRQIVSDWPAVDDCSESVALAINNSMNNLLGYPHRCEQVWSDYISVSKEELGRIFAEWRQEHAQN